ncbi:ABC transporter permease [Rhodobacteraceae bacterium]|nr:ABC transporter permease [Paracoccaceae bacterium]
MRRLMNLRIGAALTGMWCVVALLSRFWTPADPTGMNIAQRLQPPGVGGVLGTDQIGRDIASVIMSGAWTSLGIAGLATCLGGAVGIGLGLYAAGMGKRTERMIMTVLGVLFAFPPVLSAILLGAILGPGALTAVLAIGVFMVPVFARITRSAAAQIWTREYIAAAFMAGKTRLRISMEHVLPNIAGQLVVQVTLQMGLAILAEAGLSYLGMGVAPPTPSWGRMLADSQTYLSSAPHLAVVPGLAIALAVLGLNLLGDGLRDLADPRKGGAG